MSTWTDRFWRYVVKEPGENDCWPWIGSTDGRYGQFYVRGHIEKAHRVSYALAYGPIPAGKKVCHHCDNPPCVRPEHLFVGTMSDNLLDCSRKGRNGSQVKPERLARGDRNGARTMPERLARGEAHGIAKLTEAQVREIKHLLRSGAGKKAIARRFGVAAGTIRFIANGETWGHVL